MNPIIRSHELRFLRVLNKHSSSLFLCHFIQHVIYSIKSLYTRNGLMYISF